MKNFPIHVLAFCLLASLFAACQQEEEGYGSQTHGDFRLSVAELLDAPVSRGAVPARLGRVNYYLADLAGNILPMSYSGTAPDLSYIRLENLYDGEYRLLVLAESDARDLPSVAISKLESAGGGWLNQEGESAPPLGKEYYYADHAFRIDRGVISDKDVNLERLFGKVQIVLDTENDFIAPGVFRAIEITPSADSEVYTSVTGNGEYGASKQVAVFDVSDSQEFSFLPTLPGKPLRGKIRVAALTSDGDEVVSLYDFKVDITANKLSTIRLEYKHPDDENRTLVVPFVKYNGSNSRRILQDDEPKSVYYDNSQRRVDVKNPLQVKFLDQERLRIRFYSPVGLSNVRLLWTDNGEVLEFARFDSIPPYCEASFVHPLSRAGGLVTAADGRRVWRDRIPNLTSAEIDLTIACDDTYWQKLRKIIPSVTLKFDSFGGNPDAPNGGPAGNWMGIRPVHIREALVCMTNMCYLFSSDDFVTMIRDSESSFYDDGKRPIPADRIISQSRRNRELTVGLVWTGNGVVGLGSPSVWGIHQIGYFNHYNNNTFTSYHEYGHVMGYGHNSNMTYSLFPDLLQSLHHTFTKRGAMPVSSGSVLNSWNNPNRY